MSTIDRGPAVAIPPLFAGDHLDAPTFHERYEAMPPSTRAELIGGVVHMPSPLYLDHGSEGFAAGTWLGYYAARTPGVAGADNTSTRLDAKGEVQPDFSLRIRPESGGQSQEAREFIVGAPELIVEVSRSSRRTDLGAKQEQYERAGVLEYVVVGLDPDEIFWFILRDSRFERLAPGEDAYYRSEVFPGLWLDPAALFNEDLAGLVAVVDLGAATPEHAEFVARLERAKAERRA
jgi:Uma2 family endonuclease